MPTLTIRGMPADVLERLRRRAAQERRSLGQEAIHLIELALRAHGLSPAAQVEAWLSLGGWKSRRSAKHEIAAIYRARTSGRPVEM